MNQYLPFEATKENHLRYGFGEELSLYRSSPLDTARMSVGGIPPGEGGFMQTLESTSRTLLRRHSEGLMLFLSGGLDSEVAFRCFLQTGISFRVAVVRFTGDLNPEDFSAACAICQAAGVDPLIIEFNPLSFFESGRWQEPAMRYQCHTFYQQILASIAEDLACPLLTVDEIELINLGGGTWAFTKKEDQDACWHRFMQRTGIPAYNNYYTYDPATMIGFLGSPTVDDLVNDRIFGKLTWTSSKNQIYHELTGWKMSPRPKRHGMEKMMDIWYRVQNESGLFLPGPPVEFTFPAKDLDKSLKTGDEIQCNMI